MGIMNDMDVLAVEVDGDILVEGHDRKSLLRRRPDLPLGAPLHEPLTDVRLGDDRSLPSELCVPTRVIPVPVSVQDELQGLVRNALQSRLDLRRKGRELIVHDEETVLSGRDADVPSRPFEHEDSSGHLRGLDLHLVEILLSRRERRYSGGEREHDRPSKSAHPSSSWRAEPTLPAV